MFQAAADTDTTNSNTIAADWARAQAARTLVRAAMDGAGVIYRRTWPARESGATLRDIERDPRLTCDGWLDSTLDLRDGLSVVEVFAEAQPQAEAFVLSLTLGD